MDFPTPDSLIGGTPLVSLDHIHKGPGTLLGKCEFLQPGGSMKDRNGLWAIRAAREDGRLAPGGPVVEMTSGNMGAGIAVACARLGHPFFAVMSEGNSIARARMMEGFGAEVIRVPQVDGEPGQVTGADIAAAQEFARNLAAERGAFYVDQWNNPACVAAHYEGTGPEIWDQSEGRIDGYVMIVGTGATFVGVSRFLKERKADVICAAVEPAGAEALAGCEVTKPRHRLQGAGYGNVPQQFEPSLMDLSIAVTDEEAETVRRRLGAEEGLFVGYSAAANVAATMKLLESGRLGEDPVAATILCDLGLKYF